MPLQWVAERYLRSSPENFWAEFSDEHGQHMSFTAISKALREQRVEANRLVVQQQQAQLGQEFPQQFHVRGKPMIRPSAIAKRIERTGQF